MGTEGQRRRNRARRMRAKEMKVVKKKRDISFDAFYSLFIAAIFGYIIIDTSIETWQLCDRGVNTTAFIRNKRHRSTGKGGTYYVYEFHFNGRRYTDSSPYGNIGDYIEIRFIPDNPTNSQDIRQLEGRPIYKLYTKIKQRKDCLE